MNQDRDPHLMRERVERTVYDPFLFALSALRNCIRRSHNDDLRQLESEASRIVFFPDGYKGTDQYRTRMPRTPLFVRLEWKNEVRPADRKPIYTPVLMTYQDIQDLRLRMTEATQEFCPEETS
jgi:hypothetical protein